ncbi:MAG: O-antigen ligase family protein [Eubacteriales bacterium]|nr:O-antigen ligase family protein [Eubacteriales bacterium]
MASTKTQKSSEPKLRFTVRHALTDIYVLLMFTFFPLFLSNYYAAARRDKFWVFLILTAVVGVSVGVLSLTDFFTRNSEYNRKLNTYRDPFKLSATDIAFFVFAGVSLISALASGRISHCFTGLSTSSSGRNMGLITILLLLVCYLVISRFFFYKNYIFYGIFFGISVVSFVAILNYYYLDPLHIMEAYQNSESTFMNFTSTIGNKNYLSAFICVALPFSVGVALTSNDRIMTVIAYLSTALQFMGLIVATSDGGFLGFAAMLLVIFIAVSRNAKKLLRFFLSVSVMALAAKILKLFDIIMKGHSKGYSGFSDLFLNGFLSWVLLAVFLVLSGLTLLYLRNKDTCELPKWFIFIPISIVAAAVLGFSGLFIYFTFIDKTTELSGTLRFFRFGDTWGTHRGYFWIKSFEIWKNDLNVWQKLFGTGPDTYYFAFRPYFTELLEKFGESSTNAAHNVYINYLVTQGIVGALAYLVFIGASVWLTFKRSFRNPLALICLCVIVTYATQDIVNIANPVNSPLFFIFIALSEATLLKANSTEQLAASNY